MIIVGEKINGTRKRVGEAVTTRDDQFIIALAEDQAEAGANFIDVNAGTSPDREPEDLAWLVRTVQEVVDVPLCLDSSNPEALNAAFAEVKQTPMINSISGEPHRLEKILPLVSRNACMVIALAIDETGMPKGFDGRMTAVRKVIDATRAAGVVDENVYVDPLVLTIATETSSGEMVLDTVRAIRSEYPDVHIISGLSNISFGLAKTLAAQPNVSDACPGCRYGLGDCRSHGSGSQGDSVGNRAPLKPRQILPWLYRGLSFRTHLS